MTKLFGQHCSGTMFRHDEEMRELQLNRLSQLLEKQPQETHSTRPSPLSLIQSTSSGQAESTIIVRKTNPLESTADYAATPPREILAVSPGSESQGLRRKAVLEGLVEERVKRVRLHLDHDESSPGTAGQLLNEGSLLSQAEGKITQSTFMNTRTAAGHPPSSQGDSLVDDEDDEDEANLDAYWDPRDKVHRCGSCGHELWISKGGCFTCCTREDDTYFEVMDPDLGPRPGIVRGEDETGGNIDGDERIELLGDCLDFDSSAYDSQDERAEHNETYEIDSFINDESVLDSEDEDSHSSSDGETDYKQKFYELQRDYFGLVDEYDETLNEYDEFRREVLGSDYYDSIHGSDDLEFNDHGIVMVDVAPPDHLLTEVILSQSEQDPLSQEPDTPDSLVDESIPATDGESQKSETLTEEENARADAYAIALGGRWHDVSLVSTGGNHSYEEAEL